MCTKQHCCLPEPRFHPVSTAAHQQETLSLDNSRIHKTRLSTELVGDHLRLILPNLLFDDTLSGQNVRRTSALRRVMDSLAPLTGLIGKYGDMVLVAADGIPSAIPEPLTNIRYITKDRISEEIDSAPFRVSVTPWGWDTAARQLAKSVGTADPVPSAESVQVLNSRRFLAGFDRTIGETRITLFDSGFGIVCNETSVLQDAIEKLSHQGINRWIAKSAWSASGRNRITGNSSELSEQQRGWLVKQLDRAGYVYLEPWLPVVRECGIQLEISSLVSKGSRVNLLGATELVTDRRGSYLGSMITDHLDPLWSPAIDHAALIGLRASELGYFGPLGIDCMQVRLPDGQLLLRLCHDINARFTMGRLAMQLSPRLHGKHAGVWLHSSASSVQEHHTTTEKHPTFDGADVVDVINVSPRIIGGLPTAVDSKLYVTSGHEEAAKLVLSLRRHVGMQK
ncbi:MAG: hypothetical protein MK110_11260 [Fuerstiella sp.]|nr:hypothetical protein [Fuerstiella sp.]